MLISQRVSNLSALLDTSHSLENGESSLCLVRGQGTPQYVSQDLTGLHWHLVHLWTVWGKPSVEILHLGPDLCSLNVLCLWLQGASTDMICLVRLRSPVPSTELSWQSQAVLLEQCTCTRIETLDRIQVLSQHRQVSRFFLRSQKALHQNFRTNLHAALEGEWGINLPLQAVRGG